MKAFFVLAIFVTLGMSTFTTTTGCLCTQLLSQGDCIKQTTLGCAWDAAKSTCAKDTSTPVTPTVTYATYCEQFNQADCPTKSGCQWLTTKCSHFTGCTAFKKTTDLDCQAVNSSCITDGVHCVEKGTCSSYLKQLPCVVSKLGSLCFWDTTATPNVCVDATKCEHLPLTYLTDAECRAKISTCTAKTGGGCQDSGTNCADQTSQLQCFWNKTKLQSCFWNGTGCVDRICTNALTTYTTDDACKNYLADCTTKLGGGCVLRGACSAATNQESCKTNNSGSLCYWTSANTCVNKDCSAAPTTYTTNKQCSDFVSGCITKKGGGCKSNGTCGAADIDVACVTNSSGGSCIWNASNTCVDKICTNAPATNTTHDLCTQFMPSCTVNATNNGCRIRTCDNASTTDYDTNDKCNTYLTGCITKTGGGCTTNTTCAAIGALDKACVKDGSGNACIFDTTCKDKTCLNAPSSNDTHAKCQTYMNTCTVNSANNGCVDMTCENIQSSDNCSKDKSNNVCVWKGTCYLKQCKQAPISYATQGECTGFMTKCTVDNDGAGCMDKPPQCSGILTAAGCVVNSAGGACAWFSGKCLDMACTTAPTSSALTSDCNTYKSGCIVNNSKNGCVDPTVTACNTRTLEDNCNVSAGPVCLWNPTASTKCVAKSCDTASQTGITTSNGYIDSGSTPFSNASCGAYLTGCVINNTDDGCMAKGPCSGYKTSTNCAQGNASGGTCYWNTADSGSCVDKQCPNIKKTTHDDCEAALSTCTYGNGTVCAAKTTSCVGYTQNQCHTTSGGKACVWEGSQCRDLKCSDSKDTSDYNTHSDCSGFVSTCTVIDRVDNTGCVSLGNCSDYTNENQCVVDSASRACFWNYDVCVLDSAIVLCTDIRGPASYAAGYCVGKWNVCKNKADNSACELMACAEFTVAASYTMTNDGCAGYNSTCTVNRAGTACITKVDTCATAVDASCTTAGDGACTWTASGSGSCAKTVAAATDPCAAHTGTDLSATDCSTFQAACTANLSGTACVTKQSTCAGYLAQGDCRISTAGNCKWDPTCVDVDATIDCTKIVAESGLTYAICQTFDSTCTVNSDGTACVTIDTCTNLNAGPKCYHGSDGRCFWDGTSTCTAIAAAANCATVTGTNLTTGTCQGYNPLCNVNKAGTACQENKAACGYGTDGACSYSGTTKCFFISGTSTCTAITTASTDCLKVTGSSLTVAICTSYNSGCAPNAAQTACQEGKATCNLYQSNTACSYAGSTRCVWFSNACTTVTSSADCSKVTGSSLTYEICQTYNTACSVNAAGTACEAKSCTNKPSAGGYTDSACKTYVSTCTANLTSSATACTTTLTSCSLYTAENTCGRAVEGECVWVAAAGGVTPAGLCVKKTCSTAPLTVNYNDHTKCNAYLNTCTVAKVGGCIATGLCTAYKSKTQCEANSCFWNNRLNYGCVAKSCDAVETAYNTHALCSGTSIGCTVKANSLGCMAWAAACSGYTIQDQCHKTATNQPCLWVVPDGGTGSCVQQSCSTADIGQNTHDLCQTYSAQFTLTLASTCTVQVVVDGTGNETAGGCIVLGACSSYNSSQNCKIDTAGNDCVWNATSKTCSIIACTTAPADTTYDSDTECRAYLDDHSCTVDTSGQGCMIRPAKCDGMTQAQCVTNFAGGACEWFQDKCVDKTCETAPSTATDAAGCDGYLTGCTMDPAAKCKTQICEDFVFTTDSDCQRAKAGCTTNGTNCVARTVCQAAVEAGCVTQSDGKACQWVASLSTCVVKTCTTAPATADYATESQCASYFTGCTTKSGNGCTTKTNCANASVEAACTTASDGTKCVWDTKCRNIDCQDYSGTTYAECQAKGPNCTAGLNGKCIQLSNCETVVTRSACVYGLNGPCLWIPKYNGTGACFAHNSCKSRPWTTDSQCKLISDQCTTNGTGCLAITSCSETNTSGGCKTSYDGNCIQTVASLGSTDPAICKDYSACSDAYYTKHADCQTASVKCTTNGLTACAPLGACQSYTIEEACKINDKAGPTYDATTGAVTVTGVCKWDTTTATASCRDQICSDLTGLSHYSCYVQLSTCTSDGTNCITKGACASYTSQAACENGYGSDGPQGECFWEAASTANNNTANCRVMKCSDILNGTTTAVCQNSLSSCVSDGTACIAQDKCSNYKTLTSCNSTGTDGICVFTASTATGAVAGSGSCVLMGSCASASTDSNACAQAKDRCSWTPASGSGATAVTSKCASHTCATFASTNPLKGCTAFLSWDKGTQQVCTTVKGVCTETDPSTLTVDSCYSISGYTYTWSTSTSKCSVCTTTVPSNNNSTNTNTTNTTTDSGYILGLSSIILGYLMF